MFITVSTGAVHEALTALVKSIPHLTPHICEAQLSVYPPVYVEVPSIVLYNC